MDIAPKRFALQYSPPAIVLEYLIPSSGKLYIHMMKIRPEGLLRPAEEVFIELRRKHAAYLDPRKIGEAQVIGLIRLLQKSGEDEAIVL